MTLEVLARSTPAETPAKGGGRTAGESGEAGGFATALSKAGRGPSGEKAVAEDQQSSPDARGEDRASADTPIRYSIKNSLKNIGGSALPGEAAQSRAQQVAGFSQGKAQPGQKLGEAKNDVSEETEGPDTPVAAEEGDGATVPATADNRGAADLLTILAGLHAATSTGHMSRAGNIADGRKGAEGNGNEKSAKTSADVATEVRGKELPADMLDMPTMENPDVAKDRNLRFINVKNGSLNAELTLAAQSRDASNAEGKSGIPQTDTVMVLDSRRFIGMQTSSNGASLMAAMVGDQAWSAAMQPDATLSNITSQGSSGSVVHMLKLQMTPHDLGTVTATLKMNGEQLHVHLTVENRAAHRQLSEDSSGMLDALRSQGFSVDQVTISIASSAETDNQKGQQQGAHAGQQQTPGNGERQAGTNRDQSGPRFSDVADDRNTDNDTSLDTATSSGLGSAGGARSGQLYL